VTAEARAAAPPPLAPPGWAAAVLRWLYRVEATLTVLAFVGVNGALFADLIGREFFGRGIFVAQRFAVFCMVVLAFLGFALAVGWRAHLGIEVADRLTPRAWNAVMERLADAVAAAGCLFLAYWSWRFVAGSYADQARGQGLEILLWPVQSVMVWCFCSSALRYALCAVWPALRGVAGGR
jgi:TRAP-type C4-dicarboxylate transport system permease small subunit